MNEWDGLDRRGSDWVEYKRMMLKDIEELKDSHKELRDDFSGFRDSFVELKVKIFTITGGISIAIGAAFQIGLTVLGK